MVDFGLLSISRLIVHEVPRRLAGAGEKPDLSEIDSPLTQDLRNYFREKILQTIASNAFEVKFDPGSVSPIPKLTLDRVTTKSQSFVHGSQEMAVHLHSTQTGVNSGGLLVVAEAALGQLSALVILKLEKEEGLRVHSADVKGKHTLSIEHVRDLMLTEATRVFKVGLFWQPGQELADIDGKVADTQRGYVPRTEVADFFLRKFLGCELLIAPEVATSRFLVAGQTFINDQVGDDVRKAQYQMALLSELSSQVGSVDPRRFAREHLEVEDQNEFVSSLAAMGAPTVAFPKSLKLVEAQVRKIQLSFESGIMLLAPTDVAEDHIAMTGLGDGRTRVEFEDKLKNVRGKR